MNLWLRYRGAIANKDCGTKWKRCTFWYYPQILEVKLKLFLCLTSAPDWRLWWATRLVASPSEKDTGTYRMWDSVGSRAGLNAVDKRLFCTLAGNRTQIPLFSSRCPSHYTDSYSCSHSWRNSGKLWLKSQDVFIRPKFKLSSPKVEHITATWTRSIRRNCGLF
jgi:hypothetical protein